MGKKKKNSSKFRVSTGQNFFRWARFARQTVHRGNTTRISLLGKHVGRNTSPKYAHRNRDMSTDERGVFQNMSPLISALAIDPIVAAGRGTETGCVSCLGSEILFPFQRSFSSVSSFDIENEYHGMWDRCLLVEFNLRYSKQFPSLFVFPVFDV